MESKFLHLTINNTSSLSTAFTEDNIKLRSAWRCNLSYLSIVSYGVPKPIILVKAWKDFIAVQLTFSEKTLSKTAYFLSTP